MSPLADREEAEQAKKLLKFVMFGLGKERYAVPVLKVKEIIILTKIFPLPKMPSFIEGIISLRGDIIPIVDLRKRFDLPVVEKTDESRIVVLEMEGFYVGISVDQVYEVIKIDEESIEPPPPLVGGLRADYLEGVCELGKHLITMLNLEEIFSSTEKTILAKAAGTEEESASAAPAPRAEAPAARSAPASVALAAVPPLPAVPALKLGAPEDVTVGEDGKVKFSGRLFFVGKKFAGQSVRVEATSDGVAVSQGGNIIKRFRV